MTPKPTRAKQLSVTDAEYARLLAAQGGHCALCPNVQRTRKLHADHDHRTDSVRGLLCFRDNKIISTWVTPAWADSLYRYLVRHELLERGRMQYVLEDRGFESSCWIWARALSSGGYGVIRYAGTLLYVHRLMYHGLIQRGEHIHHRCEQRACLNPLHLQAMRGGEHTTMHARNAMTCKRGHPWTPENTYFRPDGSGLRQCRACIRIRSKWQAEKRRAA